MIHRDLFLAFFKVRFLVNSGSRTDHVFSTSGFPNASILFIIESKYICELSRTVHRVDTESIWKMKTTPPEQREKSLLKQDLAKTVWHSMRYRVAQKFTFNECLIRVLHNLSMISDQSIAVWINRIGRV